MNTDLFDELHAAGYAHAATQLTAKPQYIAPYIAFLFRHYNAAPAVPPTATTESTGVDDVADTSAPAGRAIDSRTVADILVACTWIVFSGEPVESLTRLLDAGLLPSTACGQLWQSSCACPVAGLSSCSCCSPLSLSSARLSSGLQVPHLRNRHVLGHLHRLLQGRRPHWPRLCVSDSLLSCCCCCCCC